MKKNPRSSAPLLRAALLSNAAFSTLCAALLLVDGDVLAPAMGLSDSLPLHVVGASLIPFALLLVLVARARRIDGRVALAISAADYGWVVGSGVVMLAVPLTSLGLLAVAGVALIVAVVGTLQLEGLRRTARNDRPGPRLTLSLARDMDVDPARAWEVVSDIESYHEVADNISFSRVVSGRGEGLVRECGDHEGGRWLETCTRWDEGERYAFTIDTAADDYPYPFRELRGEWSVTALDVGSRVSMRFEVTMPGGWLGDLMGAALVVPKFVPVVERLLDAWETKMRDGVLAEHAL